MKLDRKVARLVHGSMHRVRAGTSAVASKASDALARVADKTAPHGAPAEAFRPSSSVAPVRMAAPYSAAQVEALVAQHGSPLLLLDCDTVRQSYRALQAALPGVTLHYAVKAQPDPAVLATLRDAGSSFDVASTGELQQLQALGISAERCIHTHPIKTDEDIRAALAGGVKTFVVDNPDELAKFRPYRDQAQVIVRLAFRNPEASADLSAKFGCAPENALALLERARQLGVEVKGFSFHAGSQSGTPDKHVEAVETCAALMREAETRGLGKLSTLDIGGGFPARYDPGVPDIETFCAPIRAALSQLPGDVDVIAEPGRYLVAEAGTSLVSVTGRAERDGIEWVYVDDGVYGSYNGVLNDHQKPVLEPLRPRGESELRTIGGPTCDSLDVIAERAMLPALRDGDLLVARNMGAYSSQIATDFNGLRRAKVLPINVAATPSQAPGAVASASGRANIGY